MNAPTHGTAYNGCNNDYNQDSDHKNSFSRAEEWDSLLEGTIVLLVSERLLTISLCQ